VARYRTNVTVERDVHDRLMERLKEEDRSFSAFVRRAMKDYVDAHEAIKAGKTQVDPRVYRGVV